MKKSNALAVITRARMNLEELVRVDIAKGELSIASRNMQGAALRTLQQFFINITEDEFQAISKRPPDVRLRENKFFD